MRKRNAGRISKREDEEWGDKCGAKRRGGL
jgi:hypothetical protein